MRCRVPGCDSPMRGVGLCRRHYDMARKKDLCGYHNPFAKYMVRMRGVYVKGPVKKAARFALARCLCGELHVKELGCGACRVRRRRVWFAERAVGQAL
jgi:hypothetical protein